MKLTRQQRNLAALMASGHTAIAADYPVMIYRNGRSIVLARLSVAMPGIFVIGRR